MKLLLAWVIVAAALLGGAREARASCVAAVIVDGWLLLGAEADGLDLPPLDGPMTAVAPACNDAGQDEPDGRTTVMRLEGIPPNVAVVAGDTVYVVAGSLTAMGSHPLHVPSRRPPRRECGRARAVRGVVDRADADRLELLVDGRRRLVLVDARTQLTNRPAYQPLRTGQRVELTTRRCGGRVFADRIALTGPAVARQAAAREEGSPWGWVLSGVLGLVLAGLAVRRRMRPR